MMRFSTLSFLVVHILYAGVISQQPEGQDTNECTLYLAPSSIPNAGMGLYTTRQVLVGEPILSYDGPDAPSILVTNSQEHNDGNEVTWSHVDYFWSASGINEFESKYVEESVVTMGALSNYHTYLKNIKPYSYGYDDSVANRFTDPSAGAFSYYRGHVFKATKEIQPGSEIFADYGESWLSTREGTFADYIPRSENYKKAATVLKTMQEEAEKNSLVFSNAILETVKNVVQILEPLAAAVLPTSSVEYDRVTHALQKETSSSTGGIDNKMRDLLTKFTSGTASRPANSKPNPIQNTTEQNQLIITEVATELAKRTINITHHSVEWIKQNGLCLENIIPGPSTIPLAGQGAFAKRFLSKGALISPAPLIQIPDRKVLLMYELIENENDKSMIRKNDTPISSQLLLNYCFGHTESRLLLCPQTNVILINHCSTRKASEGDCGSKGPNAHVRWAGSWDPSSNEWLKKSLTDIDQLTVDGKRGLSMEFIAARDIQPGEEIFIDYGVDWEKAWDDHMDSWEPPSMSDDSYSQLTPLLTGDIEVRTLEEQETNPYPDNIMTGCYYDAADDLVDSTLVDNEYHADGSDYELDEVEDIHSSTNIFACEILSKQKDGALVVRILHLEEYVDTPLVLKNYPVSSVTLRMRRLSTDQHLSNVFRHHIGIDDSIIPSQWIDDSSSFRSEL